jgi:ankyrin repeat protein
MRDYVLAGLRKARQGIAIYSACPLNIVFTLHFAARKGNDAVVRMLLEKRTNVNLKEKFGQAALNEAVSNGHGTVVRMLLDGGADMNAKRKYGGTALHLATPKL